MRQPNVVIQNSSITADPAQATHAATKQGAGCRTGESLFLQTLSPFLFGFLARLRAR